jgi:acyl-CoA thioesterase YciA
MLPNSNEPVMRVIPMPADTNFHGDIFGGWLLGQVDLAGSVAAVRRAKGRVATVGIESLSIRAAVHVGDLVSLYASVIATGTTSIRVRIEVFAQRNPADEQTIKVTEALVTYVAVGRDGNKRALPAKITPTE